MLARTWRNWYTRTLEVRIPQGVEVQLLSSAPYACRSGEIGRPARQCLTPMW